MKLATETHQFGFIRVHVWTLFIRPEANCRLTLHHSTMLLGSEWALTLHYGVRAWAVTAGTINPKLAPDTPPETADAADEFLREARDT